MVLAFDVTKDFLSIYSPLSGVSQRQNVSVARLHALPPQLLLRLHARMHARDLHKRGGRRAPRAHRAHTGLEHPAVLLDLRVPGRNHAKRQRGRKLAGMDEQVRVGGDHDERRTDV